MQIAEYLDTCLKRLVSYLNRRGAKRREEKQNQFPKELRAPQRLSLYRKRLKDLRHLDPTE